jgi:ABC-2 type transport system ATP-binding protein
MLEVNRITKDFLSPFSFRDLVTLNFKNRCAIRALNDVSFCLTKGSILAVLGQNGAGKTTLLKIISTLILPEKGTVKLNGLSLGCDDQRLKDLIGMVGSCERSFYWRLTGQQNLEFFASLYGLSGGPARARIQELCRLFAVDYQDKRFDSYSTGMQQKFGLMRALLHDPELLLLDEPTKSLDYSSAKEFRDLIKKTMVKQQNKTVIFTTHHMDEALDFAGRFMILHKGKVLALGSLEELKEKVKDPGATLGEIFERLTCRG